MDHYVLTNITRPLSEAITTKRVSFVTIFILDSHLVQEYK